LASAAGRSRPPGAVAISCPRCREAKILQSFEVAFETIRQRKAAGGPCVMLRRE
jgi:hypothetical protein